MRSTGSGIQYYFSSYEKHQHKDDIGLKEPKDLLVQYNEALKTSRNEDHTIRSDVIRLLRRSVALARIEYGDYHWRTAKTYSQLANQYTIVPICHNQALEYALCAKEILRYKQDVVDKMEYQLNVVEMKIVLAKSYILCSKYSEGEKVLIDADDMNSKLGQQVSCNADLTSRNTSRIADCFGMLKEKQQDYEMAVQWYVTCYEELRNSDYSITSPYSRLLLSVAAVRSIVRCRLKAGNDPEKAVKYALLNVTDVKAHQTEQDESRAKEILLGDVLLEAGQTHLSAAGMREDTKKADNTKSQQQSEWLGTAMTLANEALAIALNIKSPEKKIAANDLIIKILVEQGESEQASLLLVQVESMKKKLYGDISEQVANNMQARASLKLQEGDYQESAMLLSKTIKMRSFMYGNSTDKRIKTAQSLLDQLLVMPEVKNKVQATENRLDARPRFS